MRHSFSRLGAGLAVALTLAVSSLLYSSPVEAAPDLVRFSGHGYRPGTIVVSNSQRKLYLVLRNGQAIRYPVAVGKPGKAWSGQTYINGKHWQPDWSPPAEVKRDVPHLPNLILGGAPNNPMGVAAMTLAGGQYAIHGTNRPKLIGRAVSYGCIRMHNAHIADLFQRVSVNTRVVVTH